MFPVRGRRDSFDFVAEGDRIESPLETNDAIGYAAREPFATSRNDIALSEVKTCTMCAICYTRLSKIHVSYNTIDATSDNV